MPIPLIQMNNVSRAYRLGDSTIEALRGVNLSINHGEFVAVWGPSGSGKSTLCNLVGVVDLPTEGAVLIDGCNTSTLEDDERSVLRNHAIGFVFQTFNLVRVLTALENVMLPLNLRGESDRDARQRAIAMLDELSMAAFLKHRPDRLSGGQQQRVAIARALVTEPKLVIADEPTANLDSENALHIVGLMREVNRRHGTTFIFSTHDQRLLDRVDRRIRLQDGTIVQDESSSGSPVL